MTDLNELYDLIIEYGIATAQEIELVTSINGWNEDSMNDIIYCRTGYHDIEQYQESEL